MDFETFDKKLDNLVIEAFNDKTNSKDILKSLYLSTKAVLKYIKLYG